jgi:hypothetical protein
MALPRDDCGTPSRKAGSGTPRRAATPAPVTVALDPVTRALVAFTWRRRRRLIDRIERTWVVETGWWSDELRVSRRFSRVVAEGRVFDLCYDRLARTWTLHRVVG